MFEPPSGNSVVRIKLQEGEHRLCLISSGPYFSGIVLDDSLSVLDLKGCTSVNGRNEFYRVRLSHATDQPIVPEIALLSIDGKGVPLTASNGEMRKGFWAVVPWTATGRTEAAIGRLRAVPSSGARMPILWNLTSSQMDSYSLWQFRDHAPVLLADPQSAFYFDPSAIGDSAKGTVFVGHDGEAAMLRPKGNSDRFELHLKDDDRSLAELAFAPTLFGPQTLKVVRSSPENPKPAMFSLAFRFFHDAGELDSLTEGEAALYQNPNYQGTATVFPASVRNLAALSSSVKTLEDAVASIRVGPGTEATLYSDENYAGTATRIHGDERFLTGTGRTGSIRLTPLVARLLTTRSCVGCNFDGVDLSGLDVKNVDLTGARLTGANLTHTRLDGARLENANLTGASLSCTSFSGIDASHRNDLRRTDFSNIRLVRSSSCRSNFSYTVIAAGSLSPDMQSGVNLTGALVRSVGGSLPSAYLNPLLTNGYYPPPFGAIGIPVGGYWAIQPHGEGGRMRLQLPFMKYSASAPNTAPIVFDRSSQQMDGLSLFKPPNYNLRDSDPGWAGGILGPPANTFFDWTGSQVVPGISSLGIGSNYTAELNGRYLIAVIDEGDYFFRFVCRSFSSSPCPTVLSDNFQVLFRYYPDGSQIGVLETGEAALFQEQNFKGKAAVVSSDNSLYPVNLTATNSPETTIDKTAVSIRVGNDTALIWTSALTKKGVSLLSAATGDDHRLKEWGAPTGVIRTILATDVLIGDQYPFDCSGCQMIGAELSGSAENPLRLTSKYLYDVDFSRANFSYVDLSALLLAIGIGAEIDAVFKIALPFIPGIVSEIFILGEHGTSTQVGSFVAGDRHGRFS